MLVQYICHAIDPTSFVRDLSFWWPWKVARRDVVGWERYVVLHRILRIPIVGYDLDWAFFDFLLDGNTLNPFLGVQLLCIGLAAMDTRLDAFLCVAGSRRYRIVFGDDYVRLNDDRRERGVCFTGLR